MWSVHQFSPFVRLVQVGLVFAVHKSSTGDMCAVYDGKACTKFQEDVRQSSRDNRATLISDNRMARLQHMMQQYKCLVLVKTLETYTSASMACKKANGRIADLDYKRYRPDVTDLVKCAMEKATWPNGTVDGEKGIWTNVNGTAPDGLQSFCAVSPNLSTTVNDAIFCSDPLAKGQGAAALKLTSGALCLDWNNAVEPKLPYYCEITSKCDVLSRTGKCDAFLSILQLTVSIGSELMSSDDYKSTPESVAADFNRTCFVSVPTQRTWKRAQGLCSSAGGRLAWLSNPDPTNDALVAQAIYEFVGKEAWIGVRRWKLGSGSQTLDQWDCDGGERGQSFQYPNTNGEDWWTTEADIDDKPTELLYGYVGKDSNGKVGFHFTASDTETKPVFICEKELERRTPLLPTTTTSPTTTTTTTTTTKTTVPTTFTTSTTPATPSTTPPLTSATSSSEAGQQSTVPGPIGQTTSSVEPGPGPGPTEQTQRSIGPGKRSTEETHRSIGPGKRSTEETHRSAGPDPATGGTPGPRTDATKDPTKENVTTGTKKDGKIGTETPFITIEVIVACSAIGLLIVVTAVLLIVCVAKRRKKKDEDPSTETGRSGSTMSSVGVTTPVTEPTVLQPAEQQAKPAVTGAATKKPVRTSASDEASSLSGLSSSNLSSSKEGTSESSSSASASASASTRASVSSAADTTKRGSDDDEKSVDEEGQYKIQYF